MNEKTLKTTVSVGLSDDVLKQVDKLRGDVPRSLYLRKIIDNFINADLTNCKQPGQPA